MTEEKCIDLPTNYAKVLINQIARDENFQDYSMKITSASEKGENYLGELYRINVNGGKKDSRKIDNLSLILKTAPEGIKGVLPIESYYSKETFAYSVVLPYFTEMQEKFNIKEDDAFKCAKFYKASTEEMKEMIVLEDLKETGYKMYDRLKPLDYKHVILAVRKLAAYHACSLVMKQTNSEMFCKWVEQIPKKLDFGNNFGTFLENNIERIAELLGDELLAEQLKVFGVDIDKKLDTYLCHDGLEEFSVLCHGDCWSNNFMFKYEDDTPVDMCLVDWQILRVSSPVTDLAYFIFTSTDEDFRREYFQKLIDDYHETLAKRVAEMGEDIEVCYPYEVFRRHVDDYLPYGLAMAMVVIPFTLSSRGEAPDVADVLDNKTSDLSLTEYGRERMIGVVKDFASYNMI